MSWGYLCKAPSCRSYALNQEPEGTHLCRKHWLEAADKKRLDGDCICGDGPPHERHP